MFFDSALVLAVLAKQLDDMCHHVPQHVPVLCVRWEAGDLDEWSAITYPDRLHEYVTEEFRRIKKRQADLLGIKEGIRSKL